jgi:glycosyltransferase EpsE
MPKISVIMGVYNDDTHIANAIDSILNQTYEDFEFIICDDGSKDQSVNIVNDYMKNDSRIKLLKNEKNLGLAASLNRCIDVAQGEYIARMDSDDVSLPTRFEKQVKFLDENPEIMIVGTAVDLFDETGIFGERFLNNDYSAINVFKENFFVHPTVMMRKSILIDVNGYTVASYTYRTEDYDLWCKLCEKGYRGYNLNEKLLLYREDKGSFKKRKFKFRVDLAKLKLHWYRRLNIPVKYSPQIIRPILVGLMPGFVVKIHHKRIYNGKKTK